MARIITYGFTDFDKFLDAMGTMPNEEKQKIVDIGADGYKDELPKYYDRVLSNREYAGSAHIKDHIIVKKGRSKKNAVSYVTFDNRTVHKKNATANEIAFINEFGAPKRKSKSGVVKKGRPFIKRTVEEAQKPTEAMADEFNRWVEEKLNG